jgi:hypothetical protein
LGYQAALWVEEWLVQPNGPRAGQPFELTPTQVQFLAWWYAVDAEGRWLFSHGARRLAKGSGKSPFAAVMALLEFCGPVRMDEFDASLPGGCVGQPVDMPLVQIAATAESQTANTMRMVRAFAPKSSPLVEAFKIDVGKTKFYRLPEGTLEVITSSSTAAEGAEASFVVGDETEHWRPSNGGVELAATLEDNLAKSGSRMIETSNAWVPGQSSVAEATFDAWVAQEEGRTRGETKILYDARIAPADTDMADPVSLRAALEFVRGDCWWQDVRNTMERIWSPRSRPDDSKRKYLNWPTAAYDAWVALQEWTRNRDDTVRVEAGDEIVMFFDGSKSRDATALVGCRLDDGHVFTLGVWEPDGSHDDAVEETIDAADVDRVVRASFETYKVVAFFADVREWESFTLTEWPRRYADKLEVWASKYSKPPQPVAWDMRSHREEFAKAAEACHAEILEGSFTHDGHEATTRHVANARRRPYQQWVSIGKESHDSPRKIDAAVCVIGARMVRRLVLGTRPVKKKAGRLW